MSVIEPKIIRCFHCDFGSGQRGMDRCSKCCGMGSLIVADDRYFLNTQEGYREAVYALNDSELVRETRTK